MSEFTIMDLRRPPLGRRLRLGVVGGGRGGLVGQWHASGVRLSNHWEIVAGALSSRPDNAALSATDWIIPPERSYTDWAEMARVEAAREDGVEAVFVCTPNFTHHDISAAFLKAGIAVICDKPMTRTVEEAHSLAGIAAETGTPLFVTYPYMHHAMARQAAEMVATGAIGKIRQIRAEYLQDWATGPADPESSGQAWRQDPAKVGRTAAVADIGTHAFHALEYMSGLRADALRADFHTCGAPKGGLEDTAFISLKMQDDVPAHLHISQAAPGQHCGLRVQIWGDEGGIYWDQEHPELLRHAPLGQPERHLVRGQAGSMGNGASWLSHLPPGHSEALPDAWSNLYAEMGFALASHLIGTTLPEGLIQTWDVSEGVRGVVFSDRCADSHEAGGIWLQI
ncbi:Gfo/Idh/MocA family protein [Palleronia caenipelagi]|uniref:Gfo/Idh/MocA family oxidoreductase n=1 Tax=Palleronia caenipelagi TaxID=2489174 RepID=A0A547Q313_9RHOB|nr:Gfo/Idh/MocA family oxidoreductase [Palleronia caenipelagi]TRD20776.1 Gfo/Idh/MocA family oxidoreductase [Palleronia caenipelagi]